MSEIGRIVALHRRRFDGARNGEPDERRHERRGDRSPATEGLDIEDDLIDPTTVEIRRRAAEGALGPARRAARSEPRSGPIAAGPSPCAGSRTWCGASRQNRRPVRSRGRARTCARTRQISARTEVISTQTNSHVLMGSIGGVGLSIIYGKKRASKQSVAARSRKSDPARTERDPISRGLDVRSRR